MSNIDPKNLSGPVDVLVIEDEEDISEIVEFNLIRQGFTVRTAPDGLTGFALAQQLKPRIILLDIMMPGLDGLAVLRSLRESPDSLRTVPVIMLSAKGEESDVVTGLELGADDYITKPFSASELVARVRAVLRRGDESQIQGGSKDPTTRATVGPVAIDADRHEVWVHGKKAAFTLAEFNLLKTLISKPGRVFTRDQLLEKITGGDTYVIDRNVDVHIRAIRKKLEGDAEFIQTVRGVGYKCREP